VTDDKAWMRVYGYVVFTLCCQAHMYFKVVEGTWEDRYY
jgi:hypothetical protein